MKIAFIGWRGMVGSVLVERLIQEGDFKKHDFTLFSTSQANQSGPNLGEYSFPSLQDAYDIDELTKYDCVLTCQGSDYTEKVYPRLKNNGWKGYWVDAASALRMEKDSYICLDPVNGEKLIGHIRDGAKTFVGGNCTVSLAILALHGLFKNDLIEWISSMTYQAASGAGAKSMVELINQMKFLGEYSKDAVADQQGILEIDRKITEGLNHSHFPSENFGVPLAGNFLPWIDTAVDFGQSREEWKAMAEANKILETSKQIPIDGTCVRVGAMRSHGQAFTIKLKENRDIEEVYEMIDTANSWSYVVKNDKESSVSQLTPAAVSGTLKIPVGRIRKMKMGETYLNAFTVGDQLLWGAAEPLRRMINLIEDYK